MANTKSSLARRLKLLLIHDGSDFETDMNLERGQMRVVYPCHSYGLRIGFCFWQALFINVVQCLN